MKLERRACVVQPRPRGQLETGEESLWTRRSRSKMPPNGTRVWESLSTCEPRPIRGDTAGPGRTDSRILRCSRGIDSWCEQPLQAPLEPACRYSGAIFLRATLFRVRSSAGQNGGNRSGPFGDVCATVAGTAIDRFVGPLEEQKYGGSPVSIFIAYRVRIDILCRCASVFPRKKSHDLFPVLA